MFSTSRILVAIVKFCYQCKEYDLLNENLTVLTKRRGQLKQVSSRFHLTLILIDYKGFKTY